MLLAAALAAVASEPLGADPCVAAVPLDARARWIAADDPRFSDAAFDDAGWATTTLPRSFEALGADRARVGWYRLRLSLSASPRCALALDLGVIGGSDEVWLNGAQVGRTGDPASPETGTLGIARVYAIGPEHLHAGDNVVAVRTRWPHPYPGGLLAGTPRIGPLGALFAHHAATLEHKALLDGVVIGVLFLAALLAGLPLFVARWRADFKHLFVFIALYLYAFTLDLPGVASTPTNDAPHRLVVVASLLAPAPFVAFLLRTFGVSRRLFERVGYAVFGALALLGGALADPPALVVDLWLVATLAAAVPVLVSDAFALRRAPREHASFAVGLALLALAFTAQFIIGETARLGPMLIFDVGVLAFIVSSVTALGVRLVRSEGALRDLSARALAAHEDERKRIARELHDGLGQSLAAHKLALQLRGAPVDDVADIITELRRVSHDLRPLSLADRGLVDAIRERARWLGERAGLTVTVAAPDDLDLPEAIADHIYRIFQQALANAVEHGGATTVAVSIARGRGQATLAVEDDGRGFAEARADGAGVGLVSMRERAELLGGTVRVTSRPGRGTTVTLEVPCP